MKNSPLYFPLNQHLVPLVSRDMVLKWSSGGGRWSCVHLGQMLYLLSFFIRAVMKIPDVLLFPQDESNYQQLFQAQGGKDLFIGASP